jgi:hypothetical protein
MTGLAVKPYLVAIDVNMAFAAATNGLTVGLNGPTHLNNRPAFDPKLPGSWLVDLSHVDLSRVKVNGRTVDADRLPSPFTPKGDRPTGPAWYATPTVAYAVELGFEVAPLEAHVRTPDIRAAVLANVRAGMHRKLTPQADEDRRRGRPVSGCDRHRRHRLPLHWRSMSCRTRPRASPRRAHSGSESRPGWSSTRAPRPSCGQSSSSRKAAGCSTSPT